MTPECQQDAVILQIIYPPHTDAFIGLGWEHITYPVGVGGRSI